MLAIHCFQLKIPSFTPKSINSFGIGGDIKNSWYLTLMDTSQYQHYPSLKIIKVHYLSLSHVFLPHNQFKFTSIHIHPNQTLTQTPTKIPSPNPTTQSPTIL